MVTKGGKVLSVFLLVLMTNTLFSQKIRQQSNAETIAWKETKFVPDELSGLEVPKFSFSKNEFDRDNLFRPYVACAQQSDASTLLEPQLTVIAISEVTEQERKAIAATWKDIAETFEIKYYSGIGSGIRHNRGEICVFRKNNSGSYDKLISYFVTWKPKVSAEKNFSINATAATYANSSVLASGDWYKIGITQNGIYKLDRQFLSSLGMNVTGIDPRNIQIYGNGGRILSEKNSDFKYDDLNENAIVVDGENDGSFDNSDYILFYGKGPDQWEFNPQNANDLKYTFIKHFYSDTAYYFITIGNTFGKRVQQKTSLAGAENYTTTTFDDFGFHEVDGQNLIKSGREFYGESFDILTQHSFNFSFPNMVQGDTVFAKASVVGRNTSATTQFNLTLPGNQSMLIPCGPTCAAYTCAIGVENSGFKKYIANSPSSFNLTISKQTASSVGWLNYVRLNVRRNLQYAGAQLYFRDSRTYAPGRISKFGIVSSSDLTIWDVTDHLNVAEQQALHSGSQYEFVAQTDTLREYVAFANNSFLAATAFGKIANQNLHSLTQDYDYIIITHPSFKSQALELAQLHQLYDTLDYVIATPQEIYNEFSSGAQDITALREFVRMLYKRATVKPRYLLLFGDGSYINKTGTAGGNTNFIPTYQSANSLAFIASKTTDDFFGLMDDSEGAIPGTDLVDIGIGRLPVKNTQEATAMVEKVKHYYLQQGDINQTTTACDNSSYTTFGDWRNWITFLADDAEAGPLSAWELMFVSQHSETFATQVQSIDPTFNIDKIYLDAYQQYSTSGGQKYPDAEAALNRRIQKGSLIVNYSGHGGELQLTSEGVVDVNIVNGWKNLNNLPMFVTATCEFSRFDDPARTSCGEYVLLNSQGGGICLFTTTRIAFSSDADNLCPPFFDAALHELNGWFPRTGDIIRLTKQGSNRSYTHFALLGDPAVTLAYPKQRVFTTEINAQPVVAGGNDTLKALSKITIKGFVGTKDSVKLTGFNGIVFPTVFDKPSQLATLGNDQGPGGVINFTMQKNVLYKGKSSVTNGDFEFTFIVPKDINYQFGPGKISYYAHNGSIDAAGYYDDIIVGGSDPNAPIDNAGPQIRLFMNDDNFVFGGTTNESPKIYMTMFDSSGINTVGNGIGHDITAVLDNSATNPMVLNDFYESNTNSYQAGKLYYPLSGLGEGSHTLDAKVWDVQNNSSTAHTEFVVAPSADMALKHVLNYPNPFTTRTKFFVEHNQCCVPLEMLVQIYTISGKIVKTIQTAVQNEGYRIEGIDWDGKDDYGDKIGAGVYIYRIKLKSADGKSAEKIEKLVILN
ncbi:MAG: hypothetical protein K0S33_2228 [Bacteroidetes bacterium]|jgi:hypothetical protein|nr:hypothetical protein [Bacteroidota bacterium]